MAIIAPIALGFAAQYGISPLLMGLLVIHGARPADFSISIYGGITNGVVSKAGLPLNELATFGASFAVNFAVALLLFFVLGGRRLLEQRAVAAGPSPIVPHVNIAGPQTGMQAYGDAEANSLSEEIAMETGQKVRSVAEAPAADEMIGSRAYQVSRLAGYCYWRCSHSLSSSTSASSRSPSASSCPHRAEPAEAGHRPGHLGSVDIRSEHVGATACR